MKKLASILAILLLAGIPGKLHEISAGWYKTDWGSRTTLNFELEWADEVFPIDTEEADLLGNFEYTIGGLEIYGRAAW